MRFPLRRALKPSFVLPLSLALITGVALARMASARTYDMTQSASLYVTERGQEIFLHRLNDVLAANGIDVTHYEKDLIEQKASQAFSLNRLPPHMKPFADTLTNVRGILNEWLIGFELNDPRVGTRAERVAYDAPDAKLSLRIDAERTRALGPTKTDVVVILNAEVPQVVVSADRIRAKDYNNSFLGTFGLNEPTLTFSGHGRPLTLQMTAQVHLTGQGGIEIKPLGVTNNIASSAIDFDFAKPLVMPKVQVSVNGRRGTLNTSEVEKQILALEPKLVQVLRSFLSNFVNEEFPALAATYGNERLANIEIVNELDAIQSDSSHYDANAPKIIYALRPYSLELKDTYIKLGMAGYVDDPTQTYDDNLTEKPPTRPEPILRKEMLESSDLVLALNQQVLGRLLYASFRRGSLKRFTLEDGSEIVLRGTPLISPHPTDRRLMYASIRVEQWTDGLKERVALTNPYEVELMLEVEVRPSRSRKGFDLGIKRIDPSLSSVNRHNIRFPQLSAQVASGLATRIDELNQGFQVNETRFEDVPLMESLGGIPLLVGDVEVDPSGFILFFLEYGRF